MASGIPYDSREGRAIAGAVAALMSGVSYATSSELARMLGRPFRVSVIALRSLGENELKQLQR